MAEQFYILSWKWTETPNGTYREEFVWYRPNANGYTSYLEDAGIYSAEEAKKNVDKTRGERRPITQAIPVEVARLFARSTVPATNKSIAAFNSMQADGVSAGNGRNHV